MNAPERKVETLGERVRQLREALGLTQPQLAKSVPGMGASAISQLETGNSKGVKPENLIALARRFGITPEELVTGDARTAGLRSVNIRNVAIIGFVIADPERDGHFDDMGFPPGDGAYIPWPTQDPDAYALRVRGDSLQPRIRQGELLVVEPNTPAVPGNDVVVRIKDGRKMVKQLLYRRDGEITLGSVNVHHKQLTIAVSEIESMHFVAAIVPDGGVRTNEGGEI